MSACRLFVPILKAAEKGTPHDGWKPPEGVDRAQAEKDYQKSQDRKEHFATARETLGLGLRPASLTEDLT